MIGLNLEGVREGQQGIETLSPCVESVAWEKRSDEPLAWFNRFERYRLLGPQRSLEAASQRCAEVEGQRCPTSSRTWCDASRRWQERAQAWDATQPSPLPGEEEAHRSDARQERLGMISTYPLQKRWIRAPLARRPGGLRARRNWGGHRVCAPGVGLPVPCGQVLLEIGCGHVRVTGQGGCRTKCHFALQTPPPTTAPPARRAPQGGRSGTSPYSHPAL